MFFDICGVRELLANLWSRQAALQCCFNQESIDLLIPVYMGSISEHDQFNPMMLSGIVVQVKCKVKVDTTVEQDVQPLGIARDLHAPLPYLAFAMELTESQHQSIDKKVNTAAWLPTNVPFSTLVQDWTTAVNAHASYKVQSNSDKAEANRLRAKAEEKRKLKDGYQRYSISARGASDVYGLLAGEKLKGALATLLQVTMPSPPDHSLELQHMRPLERLGKGSGHTDWMQSFVETPDQMDTSRLTSGVCRSRKIHYHDVHLAQFVSHILAVDEQRRRLGDFPKW